MRLSDQSSCPRGHLTLWVVHVLTRLECIADGVLSPAIHAQAGGSLTAYDTPSLLSPGPLLEGSVGDYCVG